MQKATFAITIPHFFSPISRANNSTLKKEILLKILGQCPYFH